MEGSFSPLHKADQNCHVLSGGANRRLWASLYGHESHKGLFGVAARARGLVMWGSQSG